jgi:class 3 adenylate cyclase/tetratricopeptide (TPR) repeat protein
MPVLTCPSCGRENPEGFRFCGFCSTPLTPGEGREVRKLVTVLFCDVMGSTSLGERLDPESLRGVMSRYFDIARAALERHGGTVEKFIGDAVVAVFGVPVAHEDDALRAARAAFELRESLVELNEELERTWGAHLRIRIGINTGDVVAGDPASGQSFVSGDVVNVAARLEQGAQPDEILIGADTLPLLEGAVRVEPVEPLSLRGKAEAVPAFRLLEVAVGAARVARRLDSPMVGRDGELQQLLDAFERARDGKSCQIVTVLGLAGVGKSRLTRELLSRLGDGPRVLEGSCLPYGEGITFWPIAEMVKHAAGIEDVDDSSTARDKIGRLLEKDGDESLLIRDRVAAAIGITEAQGDIQETFWAVRRLFESLARNQPVVAVFEDVHWAESTLLDLIGYVAGFSHGRPILLLCTARPELVEARPDWGGAGKVVSLSPLKAVEGAVLVQNLIGQATLPEQIRGRILDAAEGNPLFVEEMLKMLIDDGFLERNNKEWVATADLSRMSTPKTILALITARLDRLQQQERSVLQRASVIGRVFYWGAVTDLSPQPARTSVGARLQSLLRKELIQPEPSPFAGDDAFRFSHILIRDAAYESMPKRTRADLHERFATWLEHIVGDRLPEYEEIVGYHLEQAYRYLSELGPIADHGLAVGERASTRLSHAGRRAFARGDMKAAAGLLSRAADLLPRADPTRVQLLPEIAEVLTQTGAWGEAESVLKEAIDAARTLGDSRSEALATVRLTWLSLHTQRYTTNMDALPELDRAISTFEELGDDAGLADALSLAGSIEFWSGRAGRAIELSDRAISYARRSSDTRRESEALRWRSIAECFGPTPAGEAALDFEALMRNPAAQHGGFRTAIATFRADMEAMRGNGQIARELLDMAKTWAKDFGLQMYYASGVLRTSSHVAILAGDKQRAEQDLREAVDSLRRIGDAGHLSSVAPLLAEILHERGESEEALALTKEAEQASLDGDVDAQVHWRRVRSKILAGRGDRAEALRLATEAVDLARRTDYLDMRGEACMSHAEVLRLDGQDDEASRMLQEANEMFELKGNVVMAARARASLAEAQT